MKKLYGLLTVAGLSFGQSALSNEPHKKLNKKVWVNEDEIEGDVTYLLENGYMKIPYDRMLGQWNRKQKVLLAIASGDDFSSSRSVENDTNTDWQCYIQSPKDKCVINKDYLRNKFTTHYEN